MSLQHLFFPSTPGQLLTRAGAGTARDIGVHVFTFVFGDNDDGALYHSVDTSVGDADREVRMTASDNRLTVVDSELGTTTQPGDGDDADGASDVIETVQAVLVWTPPTVEESEQLCKAMLESVASKSKKGEAAWEKKLASLLEEQTRGRASLAALAAAEKSLAVPEKPMRRKFLLRLTRPQTAVFAPLCTDKDVQIVYSKPSYEGSKKIGAEERSMIEIEEERDGWLRYHPQPGDPLQCWVIASAHNGKWELAPAQSSADLQTEFMVESSLELLMFALGKEADVSDVLLSCTRRFAGRLPPLSLFDSTGAIVEKSIQVLIDWLTERATTVVGAESVVVVLVQLALARGSLPAVLQLAHFLAGQPQLITTKVLAELTKLSDIDSFEAAPKSSFKPAPGSIADFAEE